jgi:hypothetical protein
MHQAYKSAEVLDTKVLEKKEMHVSDCKVGFHWSGRLGYVGWKVDFLGDTKK